MLSGTMAPGDSGDGGGCGGWGLEGGAGKWSVKSVRVWGQLRDVRGGMGDAVAEEKEVVKKVAVEELYVWIWENQRGWWLV